MTLLALGFRPFFLAAGLAAVVLVAFWLAQLWGLASAPAYYAAVGGAPAWHAHEMLFGYVMAVVAGFLLTAARNWTGLPTAVGGRLALLLVVWAAGRLAPFVPGLPDTGVAIVELAFLPALCVSLGGLLLRRPQARNLILLAVLVLLLLADVLVHLQALGITLATARRGLLLAVDLVVLMLVLLGGRLLPFFVRRALPGSRPSSWPPIEALAIASIASIAAGRVLLADPEASIALRILTLAAAIVHAVRLFGWHDPRLWSVPLLWILFAGYAWIVAGLALRAASPVVPLADTLGLHALTVGGMGSFTLGMMSRVSLGHTGRPLVAPGAAAAAFVLVSLAAAVRVLLPLVSPSRYASFLSVSALLWIGAFALYSARYWPILTRPRVDGAPG